MLILGLSRGLRMLKGAAVEFVMAQAESVAYMTNFARCYIETQFQLHKYSPVYLKMQSSVL